MRLVTRMSFSGLACGAILMELGIIDCWRFVTAKEVNEASIEVTEDDILCGLPYIKGCGLWFDNHSSEKTRMDEDELIEGAYYSAPSSARMVYDYYNGRERIPHMEEMLQAVDKVSTGNLTINEIIKPVGWVLLGFIIDPRTGLERRHDRIRSFSIDDVSLMEELMDTCRDYGIDDLLMMPNVAERVEVYWQQNDIFSKMLLKNCRTEGDVIIADMRGLEQIHTGNRFLLYSLFPQQNISIWIENNDNYCDFAVGYSIINRTATADVGEMMLAYGGGGHRQVGACHVPSEKADEVLGEMLFKLKIAAASD
jgi:hypothetical protein